MSGWSGCAGRPQGDVFRLPYQYDELVRDVVSGHAEGSDSWPGKQEKGVYGLSVDPVPMVGNHWSRD